MEVTVPILQDSIVEATETFFCDLDTDEQQPVIIETGTATVHILDEDGDGK